MKYSVVGVDNASRPACGFTGPFMPSPSAGEWRRQGRDDPAEQDCPADGTLGTSVARFPKGLDTT
jgi:hypothetical protein